MRVLVVGGGGREHALAWRLARSPSVAEVLVAPGNAGTAREPGVANVPVPADDLPGLVALARERAVELTVVGPEAPLVAGIVDAFRAAGLTCLGPNRDGARLEGSKAFAKAFMQRHGIPTARFAHFTDWPAARAYIEAHPEPLVVKADGLAAGKGVVVAETRQQALDAARRMLVEGAHGGAGRAIVVEEFLAGEEASFIVLADGERAVAMASSQDHKRRDEGDRGPNTGGMGAYSPAPVLDETLAARVMASVIEPTLAGMAAEGAPYRGFLYAGLMIDATGEPRVLEFNCRFGDPEAQAVVMRLEGDLGALCRAAAAGDLRAAEAPRWDRRPAVAVVMAAEGYPERPRTGDVISGLDQPDPEGVKVFHAGTALDASGRVVTAGGRVLAVSALGDTVAAAAERAYARCATIRWPGAFYRRDIGHRAIARERGAG